MKRTNSRTRTRVLRPWLTALLLLFGICLDVSAQEYPEYYRKALNVIKDGHTYRIFTEVDGQRYYVTGDGRLTTNKTDAPAYLFTKTRGEAWEFGFMLQNGNTYFTSPDESITTYDACESLDHLCTTSTSPSSVWDAQVFFLNDAGKYAIRSSNAPYIFGDEGRNALCDWGWTVRTGAKGPEMGYHGVLDYIWQLDEDLSTGIYTEHTSTYYFGTTFPLFQFEVDNAEGLTPIDDDVTVNYTRYALNGNTYWTEHYAFSKLKKHNLGSGTFAYDLPFSFTEEHPELSHDELTLDNLIITANVFINMRNAQGETRRVVATSHLKYKYRDIVIDNIEGEMTYIAGSAPKFVQEIRYARKGSSVVFKIPQQNISSSYIPKSEWQERVEDGEYEHITITYQPHYSNWNDAITEVDFNTYVYYPDQNDTLVSHITLVPVDPYEHMTLYVDGFPENSTTFSEVIDVGQQVESLQNDLKDGGIVSWNVDSYIPIGYFQAFDDLYGGADVTLTCDGEVIQKMTQFNGAFSFRPPTDGHTYNVEVYFPG